MVRYVCCIRVVAQLGSALDWGSRGRRFKSCLPDQIQTGRAFSGSRLILLNPLGRGTEAMRVTIFADGGSRGNPGPAASGSVVYDESGAVLREIGTFLGVATNNVAEWTALLDGLEAALELGATDVTVRMDSELVVKQIAGVYRVKHPGLQPLHAKAKVLLRRFASYEIGHVPRKQNAAADAVVNQVLDAHAR